MEVVGALRRGECYRPLQRRGARGEQIPRLRLLAPRPIVKVSHAHVVLCVVREVVLADEACGGVDYPLGIEDDKVAQSGCVVPEQRILRVEEGEHHGERLIDGDVGAWHAKPLRDSAHLLKG